MEKTYHLRRRRKPTLQHHCGLGAKVGGLPNNQVGKFAHLHTANDMAHAMCNGWIDRVLTDVHLHAMVIGIGAHILLQRPTLDFVLVRCIPRANDDLTASPHGL